jgi:hypothetical protein
VASEARTIQTLMAALALLTEEVRQTRAGQYAEAERIGLYNALSIAQTALDESKAKKRD